MAGLSNIGSARRSWCPVHEREPCLTLLRLPPLRNAIRFVELIGEPPLQYLAQWRMQAAARLLLETRATLAA
jgi:hypothetical protein